jgi:hypothetical protein
MKSTVGLLTQDDKWFLQDFIDFVRQKASSYEKFNPPMRREAFYVCHKRDYTL